MSGEAEGERDHMYALCRRRRGLGWQGPDRVVQPPYPFTPGFRSQPSNSSYDDSENRHSPTRCIHSRVANAIARSRKYHTGIRLKPSQTRDEEIAAQQVCSQPLLFIEKVMNRHIMRKYTMSTTALF